MILTYAVEFLLKIYSLCIIIKHNKLLADNVTWCTQHRT